MLILSFLRFCRPVGIWCLWVKRKRMELRDRLIFNAFFGAPNKFDGRIYILDLTTLFSVFIKLWTETNLELYLVWILYLSSFLLRPFKIWHHSQHAITSPAAATPTGILSDLYSNNDNEVTEEYYLWILLWQCLQQQLVYQRLSRTPSSYHRIVRMVSPFYQERNVYYK